MAHTTHSNYRIGGWMFPFPCNVNKLLIACIWSLVLAACSKGVPSPVPTSDGHAPPKVERKFAAIAPGTAVLPNGGACNFDTIGTRDRDLQQFEVSRLAMTKYVGWAILSVSDSNIGKSVQLVLSGADNKKFAAIADRDTRPDVATFLKNKDVAGAGFVLEADATDVPAGNYVLSVLIENEGKWFECGITKKIVVK